MNRADKLFATRASRQAGAVVSLLMAALFGAPATALAQATKQEEIAHPFFTHEGLPDPVGSLSTRISGLATRADGSTEGDFAYHVETGLTENIGLHVRSDEFLNSRRSEIMLQFTAFKSKDGESGFAPLIELEVPTRAGGGKPAVLVGFTAKLANSKIAFNQVVHYNPAKKIVEASAALVLRATEEIYPVLELLGEGGRGEPTVINMLAGVKYRLRGSVLLGVAYQRPVTTARDLASQLVFQLEFKLGKAAR